MSKRLRRRKTLSLDLEWLDLSHGSGWAPVGLMEAEAVQFDDGLAAVFEPSNPRSDVYLLVHDVFHHKALGLEFTQYGEALAEMVGIEYPSRPTAEKQDMRNAAGRELWEWRYAYGNKVSLAEWRRDVAEARRRARITYGWTGYAPWRYDEAIRTALRFARDEYWLTDQVTLTLHLETLEAKVRPTMGIQRYRELEALENY